ncbi:MAG: GNAT family N-acetyltransferase [Candidatus Gastranaerophilales bacterium]|nr:GNAT family N-acetyltransferase [Candidatus Gastranaerophilales bacterium]
MRLRPYISAKDYRYVERWLQDRRIHSLWCAALVVYPLTEEALCAFLEKDAEEWGGCAFVATEDNGTPIGFFIYSVNTEDNSGFLKFVVLDDQIRGRGYGAQMLKLALTYAFEVTGVTSVRINVFDVNSGARKCYEKVGFVEKEYEKDVFSYAGENWGRYRMEISSDNLV